VAVEKTEPCHRTGSFGHTSRLVGIEPAVAPLYRASGACLPTHLVCPVPVQEGTRAVAAWPTRHKGESTCDGAGPGGVFLRKSGDIPFHRRHPLVWSSVPLPGPPSRAVTKAARDPNTAAGSHSASQSATCRAAARAEQCARPRFRVVTVRHPYAPAAGVVFDIIRVTCCPATWPAASFIARSCGLILGRDDWEAKEPNKSSPTYGRARQRVAVQSVYSNAGTEATMCLTRLLAITGLDRIS
jgi:hypothetical protein